MKKDYRLVGFLCMGLSLVAAVLIYFIDPYYSHSCKLIHDFLQFIIFPITVFASGFFFNRKK